jgi:hypothetical protein
MGERERERERELAHNATPEITLIHVHAHVILRHCNSVNQHEDGPCMHILGGAWD